jgi:uncharacterized membrane protein YfcA
MTQVEFIEILLIGFAAQMVDGAMGMAYGLTASSCLMSLGMPPVTVSATVHLAETFTTGASAYSHHRMGNVDREMFMKLLIPGVVGAATGAYLLASLPGEQLRPWVAGYILVMGLVVFGKAFTQIPPVKVATRLRSLGFFGALIDAMGGGGWGPIVTSTLLARGGEVRHTVGTINAVEFFVTATASVVFLLSAGAGYWTYVIPLALGGLLAAPFGAWACKRIPHKPMLAVVGILIMLISARTLWKVFH